MRLAFVAFLMMSSVLAVHAEEADCETPTESKIEPIMAVATAATAATADTNECPNRKKLTGLCVFVSNRVKDSSGKNKWLYQTKLMEAACVSENDSEEKKNEKIKLAWTTYEDDLKCSGAQFDVTRGNILKWGVSYQFEDFIKDVLKYKVDLNRVDESDGRTVLDYIKFHLDRNKGNGMEMYYKDYYERFRAAGAKHKSEL